MRVVVTKHKTSTGTWGINQAAMVREKKKEKDFLGEAYGAAMDRLARLRSEPSAERGCVDNVPLTLSTRKDCRENTGGQWAIMERSMSELAVGDRYETKVGCEKKPCMIPAEMIRGGLVRYH